MAAWLRETMYMNCVAATSRNTTFWPTTIHRGKRVSKPTPGENRPQQAITIAARTVPMITKLNESRRYGTANTIGTAMMTAV